MSLMKHLPTLLFLVPAFVLAPTASAKKFPEHFENSKWDANKPPVVDEPPINGQLAMTAWNKALSTPSKYCDSKRSWIVSNGSRLEALGVKEHNIEVRGAFLR